MSLPGPIWGPGELGAEAWGSLAGEHRWGDASLLVSECLRARGGRLPASLLGDHGLRGDVTLQLRAEPESFSVGPVGADPSWRRHGVLWLGAGRLLAAGCSASEMALPGAASRPEVAPAGSAPWAGEESARGGPGGGASEDGLGSSS